MNILRIRLLVSLFRPLHVIILKTTLESFLMHNSQKMKKKNTGSSNRDALVFARREADGPGRCLMMPRRGCGLCGGSGLSALRPAAWVCQRGAGPVCPLHLPRLFLCPTPYQTGQVTCPAASGPTTLLTTPGSSRLITNHPFPRIRTRDFRCSGTQWEKDLQYWDRSIHHLLSTNRNSPEAVTTT